MSYAYLHIKLTTRGNNKRRCSSSSSTCTSKRSRTASGRAGANSANTVDLRDAGSDSEEPVSRRSFRGTDGMRDPSAPRMWDA